MIHVGEGTAAMTAVVMACRTDVVIMRGIAMLVNALTG